MLVKKPSIAFRHHPFPIGSVKHPLMLDESQSAMVKLLVVKVVIPTENAVLLQPFLAFRPETPGLRTAFFSGPNEDVWDAKKP